MNTSQSPDTMQYAMTVNGPITPSQLGFTLMHEHLFLGGWSPGPGPGTPASHVALWETPIKLEHLGLARDGVVFKDLRLDDEPLAIREVFDYRAMGGKTIVDTTSIGIGRDPSALRKVSVKTGTNIVMGSGWYVKDSHPDDMDDRTAEDLAEEIIKDITIGIDDVGTRAGIIGEIGINGNPLTSNERKVLIASAWASKETGASISLHYGGFGEERFEVAKLLDHEGADLSRVIFGHSDSYAMDISLLTRLLSTGSCVEFDLLGRPGAPIARSPGIPGKNPWGPQATDIMVTEILPRLITAGFAEQLLLSHDIGFKIWLRSRGGNGYTFLLDQVRSHLKQLGITEAQFRIMTIETPQRLLTLG
jgi:phosphotriesterase-related protein